VRIDCGAADRRVDENEPEFPKGRNALQHFYGFGRHFRADTVAA
jgi:hypothetical protein